MKRKVIYNIGALIMVSISAIIHKGTVFEFSTIIICFSIAVILIIKADIKN